MDPVHRAFRGGRPVERAAVEELEVVVPGGAAAGEFVQMDLRQRLAVLRVPLLREELVFHRKAGNQQDRGLGVFCADDVEES